jgi:hypothetical protein
MTTRLDGPATVFLPFNQGDGGGAGNPPNPAGGHRTAYLWEQVWARESWLEILGRYLVAQREDKKKQITKVLFPRFHQLDVTRKLQAAVLRDGPGGKYLIQHSAGSGKTNSIAWTAHFLPSCTTPATARSVRHRARGLRPQRHRQAAPGGALRLRAHDRRRRHHQGRGRQQER